MSPEAMDDFVKNAAYQAQVNEARVMRNFGNLMGAVGGAPRTGNRVNGAVKAMAYNSSWLDRELDLTTRGFVAGIGSIANDLGLNRRVTEYASSAADAKPRAYMDSFFGKGIRGGTGYVHPIMDDAGRVVWRTAATLDDATVGWARHIESAATNPSNGFLMKTATGMRRSIFNALGGSTGTLNKALTAAGGAGSLVAPALMGLTAISDFREGYRKGGVLGGIGKASVGIATGWVINKMVAAALLNPIVALTAGAVVAGTAYATYKVFDVKNKGNEYLRMKQMQGNPWTRGPTAGMGSNMANTIRQRGIAAMENSRFNGMRSMGNESYMINAPKGRYANSTAMYSQSPMLSY
jgi:hypothetical protein